MVVYRVQFLSSPQQRNIEQVTADGMSYAPYIYFYKNEYRYTAGEFTTLPPARELQSALRKSGYPQAFVAAFKNNIRTLDLTLFIMVEADRKLIMAKADEQARIAEQARSAGYTKTDERAIAEEKARMAEAKPVVAESTAPVSEKVNDAVIYRVQILTSSTPKSKSQITVNGENYSTFEYLYSGAYRICVVNSAPLPLPGNFKVHCENQAMLRHSWSPSGIMSDRLMRHYSNSTKHYSRLSRAYLR